MQERRAGYARLPAQLLCQPVNADRVPAQWIRWPGGSDRVLLYLHGGAYCLGSVHTHRELMGRMAQATGCRVLALDYRLAPEHPFPAGLEDLLAAYGWLLAQGIDPAQIFLAGDSAGGGLTVAGLLALRDAGMPLPGGGICLSPWVDLTLSGASIQERAKADPILDPASLARYAAAYAGETPLTAPLLSPLYAALHGLPPLLIQVGADEILLDDALGLARKAREAGVDVTLQVWPGLFHVFQTVAFLPETRQALEGAARFVERLGHRFTG
jgi:acetyl esterase/lipase